MTSSTLTTSNPWVRWPVALATAATYSAGNAAVYWHSMLISPEILNEAGLIDKSSVKDWEYATTPLAWMFTAFIFASSVCSFAEKINEKLKPEQLKGLDALPVARLKESGLLQKSYYYLNSTMVWMAAAGKALGTSLSVFSLLTRVLPGAGIYFDITIGAIAVAFCLPGNYFSQVAQLFPKSLCDILFRPPIESQAIVERGLDDSRFETELTGPRKHVNQHARYLATTYSFCDGALYAVAALPHNIAKKTRDAHNLHKAYKNHSSAHWRALYIALASTGGLGVTIASLRSFSEKIRTTLNLPIPNISESTKKTQEFYDEHLRKPVAGFATFLGKSWPSSLSLFALTLELGMSETGSLSVAGLCFIATGVSQYALLTEEKVAHTLAFDV